VASNRELASLQATAAGRGEIPAAIDRLAAELREELRLDAGAKPGGGPAVRSDVPLSREATGNVNALHAYSVGVAAMLDGRTDAAVKAFESAAALDPKFVQAQMQLAWLYGANHAEGASAGAARRAEAETGASSTRTVLLAKYTYEVNAVGDLDRAAAAIQEFVGLYPHDPEGAQGLARVLRLQGRFGEALDVAERALAGDPHDDGLYGQAEFSLIAMDRYDAALALEQQSAQKALPHAGTALTAAYLEGGNSAGEDPAGTDDRLASAIERVTRPPSRAVAMAAYGLYLDNTGQLAAGGALWRTAAAGLPGDSALVEGGPWLLAQGALDQALAGECGAGMDMTRMAAGYGALGMSASFHAGMAAALCGDKELAQQEIAALEHDWPEASAVSGYYLPDLNAAVALGAHDPQAALDALNGARPYDLISLTPYLRGLAHVALHQDQMGIVDFQTVLGHRGTAVTGGSDVYPMAEIGVARAFAASGDKANSVQAYRRFLELWRRGDVGQKLRVEAIAAVGR